MKRLLASIAVLSAACGTYHPYNYDYAFLDPSFSATEAAYVFGAFDEVPVVGDAAAVSLEAVAAAIAARASEGFTSRCVRASAVGATVMFELEDCESRFGGRSIEGRVGIVLSQDDGQLSFELASSNLRVDREEFVIDLRGTATSEGTRRVISFESRSRAPTLVDSRGASGTISWEQGNPCVTIDAQSTSQWKDLSLSSTVSGYQRCADRCPSAGSVTVRGGEGVFFGSFDGSDTLRVFAPNGGDRSFGLECR